ncbi:hypothetical protein B0H19DRAFT_127269 [Mycena capillaripes]|nr:hypothetical protein B0H19DRAFT_127269 [Mycena capillaripes]
MVSSGLTSASWIWTAHSNGSVETVAFLKSFSTPSEKIASDAVISITAVENFTLFVNGQPIGASGTGQDEWKSAHLLRAALNSSENVFSVLVNSGPSTSPGPGLLAAIQISYTDSTNSTLVSNSSWLASSDIPSDFPTPSDLSRFASAAVAASYGSGPWGKNVALPLPDPSPLALLGSTWIWSTADASLAAPVGTVGFRKVFTTPSGKISEYATILLTVDNTFALWINGNYVGSPPADPNVDSVLSAWFHPQQFNVTLNPSLNVFNVIAQNFPTAGTTEPSGAGFIAAIQVHYNDGSSDIIRTDSSWLHGDSTSVPTFLSTSDSLLSPSVAQGPLGMAPWTPLRGIADALDAGRVPTAALNASPTAPSNASPTTLSSASSPATRSHSVPVAAIVAPIVGVVAIAAIIIAFFVWKSSRSAKTQTGFPIVIPFSGYRAVPSDTSSFSEAPLLMGGVGYADAPPSYYPYGESEPLVAGVSGLRKLRT